MKRRTDRYISCNSRRSVCSCVVFLVFLFVVYIYILFEAIANSALVVWARKAGTC